MFFGIIDSILSEMAARFSERNGKYMAALDAFVPASVNFLEAEKVKPLLDLTNTDMVEAQFTVAREFLKSRCVTTCIMLCCSLNHFTETGWVKHWTFLL